MKAVKKQPIVDLNITSVSKAGNGVAQMERPDASPVEIEIPFTTPGDVVRAQILKKKKGIIFGKLQEILVASPSRIAPRCIHFGYCGGCRFQHISHQTQLQIKENLVRKYFQHLMTPEVEFRPI